MFKKKNILYICLLAFIILIIFENLSAFQIQREIIIERQRLAEIEKELAKYREIIEERKFIMELYESGKFNEVKRYFQDLADTIEKAYNRLDYNTVSENHLRMRFVYRDITPVLDLYYFYDALYSYVVGDVTQTQQKMQYLLNNYPSSVKARQAVNFLLTINIVRNQNDDYIEVYNRFSVYRSTKLYYWLGQAHFNKGDYVKATAVFAEIADDRQYSFRSQMMLGMIAYATNEKEKAIDIFIDLNNRYTDREPYYDFAILALARLYAQSEYYKESLTMYDRYQKHIKGSLTTDLSYEIALVAKEAGNYERALGMYRNIINLPQTSDYFDKALSQIAIIQADMFNLAAAQDLIEDVVINNHSYSDLLQMQTERLRTVQTELNDYFTLDEARKQTKRQAIYRLFDQIETIGRGKDSIGDFGIKRSELDVIDFVLTEYSNLMRTVLETDDTIKLLAQKSNDNQVRLIERLITDIDTLRIDLLTYMFVHQLRFDNVDEWNKVLQPSSFHRRLVIMNEVNEKMITSHRTARRIARDIVRYENMQLELQEGESSVRETDAIRNTIELLYREAEADLGTLDYSDPYLVSMKEELENLFSFRQQAVEVKDLVARYYHQRLAQRLARTNLSIFNNGEEIHRFAMEIITAFIEDLADMNLEYNYALLDIQFKEVLRMDKEYANLANQPAENLSNEGM